MFRCFFLNRKWLPWSVFGTLTILAAIWYQVELNVQINDWFGRFYNAIQEMLSKPGSTSLSEFYGYIFDFARIAGINILVLVVTNFLSQHYIFRWRTAMTEYYASYWPQLRNIEGASQRVQEDTMRFASTMERLGENFLNAFNSNCFFTHTLASERAY